MLGKQRALLMPLILTCVVLSGIRIAYSDDNSPHSSPPPIKWSKGPMKASLGSIAKIDVPEGYLFADREGTQKFLELTHNTPSGNELGLIVPQSNQENWFMTFEFNDIGYVKDEEKDSLDAAKILESLRKNTENANVKRQEKGWKAFHVTGWHTQPFYDPQTNNLTWAINGAEDQGANPAVNYSVRILGRRGTMSVDLVLDPNDVGATVPEFKALLNGFRFTEGNRYVDFVKGDNVASYGLTALIAGGATAVAIKTGLFAKFWKLLVVLFAAILGALKKLWNRVKSAASGEEDLTKMPPSQETKQ